MCHETELTAIKASICFQNNINRLSLVFVKLVFHLTMTGW